jgi:tungstate transport system ATP-binding protein
MPLFEAKKLTKSYEGRTVLDLPELLVEMGKIYALQGPNGSGKTTLLEILSLLIPPTTGELLYQGKTVDFTSRGLTALRREIVMVHQNPVLFTTTVHGNLEFGLKVRGIAKSTREKILLESLDLVGMRGFLRAEAHKLSGGETQRVAIARALACSPRVMLFDEPTSSVDVENKNIIERIITDINSEKKISVVFTTHDLTQASKLSHEVIPLFEGRKVPSVYENIFTSTISAADEGKMRCHIRDDITLLAETGTEGKVKISIDPLKISFHKNGRHDSDINVLKGKLVQLTDEQTLVRAAVDVGIPLNILLPKEVFKEQSLTVGDEVTVLIPGEAITVF